MARNYCPGYETPACYPDSGLYTPFYGYHAHNEGGAGAGGDTGAGGGNPPISSGANPQNAPLTNLSGAAGTLASLFSGSAAGSGTGLAGDGIWWLVLGAVVLYAVTRK